MIKTCSKCGHPIPGDEISRALSRSQLKVYEIVRDAGTLGISREGVMSRLYANDPDGGPVNANVISVFAHNANKTLRPFGLALSASRGRWSVWRLVRTSS